MCCGVLTHSSQKFKVNLGNVDPHGLQDLESDILLLQDDRQQDMFRAGLVRAVFLCLDLCHMENLLAARRIPLVVKKRKTSGMNVELGDHLLQTFLRHPVLRENSGGNTVRFLGKSQNQMLCSDIILIRLLGSTLGRPEGSKGIFGVIILHEIDFFLFISLIVFLSGISGSLLFSSVHGRSFIIIVNTIHHTMKFQPRHVAASGLCQQFTKVFFQLRPCTHRIHVNTYYSSAPAVHLYKALLSQDRVGLVDCMHVDADVIRHLAYRGKRLTFLQSCGRNTQNDLIAQLLVNRFITAKVDLD